MKVSRLHFGITKGSWVFNLLWKEGCGCIILNIGPLYFFWLSEECEEDEK